ncbi:hypothetical protein GLOTRDRAFT_109293, partial [Gloeophyllum trabeum ATCC 11539]
MTSSRQATQTYPSMHKRPLPVRPNPSRESPSESCGTPSCFNPPPLSFIHSRPSPLAIWRRTPTPPA